MTTKNASNIKIAILVRMFPNIVQTYVLNHILSLKQAGASTVIIAERKVDQKEIHPRVIENRLVNETRYITTEKLGIKNFFTRFQYLRLGYLSNLLKLVFSSIWFKHGIKYSLKSMVRLVALNDNYNIIHSHSLFSSYDYLFLKEQFSIPSTTTFHGLVPKNVTMLDGKKIQQVLDSDDAFFVNTHFAEKQLMGLGCKQEKIHIIPQGTNTDDFPYREREIDKEKDIILLSVGRLSIEKGFHIAVDAIALLKDEFPSIQYHIIGGGLEEDALQKQIEQHGLQNNVKIFGSVSTELLQQQYELAQAFILPSIDFKDGSHTETQGVVLQEAQASGIPVIASRTGGIPEVIKDNETGLLFDEENTTQLAQHLKSLILDPALYKKLSQQAKKDVDDNYSIEVICQRLIKVYNQILGH